MPIDASPKAVAAGVADAIVRQPPTAGDIQQAVRLILDRQPKIGLKTIAAPECVVESYFRCRVTHALQQTYHITVADLPGCVNSSHTTSRGICLVSSHDHLLPDAIWASEWRNFQVEHPEVNIVVRGRRSPKRADLHVVAHGQIVSVEFKYVGLSDSLDVDGCRRQAERYIQNRGAVVVAICSPRRDDGFVAGVAKVRSALKPRALVVAVTTPSIATRRVEIENSGDRRLRMAGTWDLADCVNLSRADVI